MKQLRFFSNKTKLQGKPVPITIPTSEPKPKLKVKNLPLHKTHLMTVPKPTMVPFAGYQMPLQYSSIKSEHYAVRNYAGLFDVSHMGEFLIEGSKANQSVQELLTNNTRKLQPNQAQYNLMCNPSGTVIDDTILYKISDNRYMLVVNAINIEKNLKHLWSFKALKMFTDQELSITDISEDLCLLALQGPKSYRILDKILNQDELSQLPFYHFYVSDTNPLQIISRTGYTGELGYEIYLSPQKAIQLWNDILEAEQEYQVQPAGLGARDILRLEAGYCLYGHELSERIYPQEAGISWAVKMKAGDFIGRDSLQAIRSGPRGFRRKLVAFKMTNRAIPRENYEIFSGQFKTPFSPIEYVTSGGFSPLINKGIGLGLINHHSDPNSKRNIGPGDKIQIKIRNKFEEAIIVKSPFYNNPSIKSVPIF